MILVGGATRMPVVRETIRELFGRDPLCKFNPDEVVGLGAAVQAALIGDDAAVDDMVMTDVCPFTLGVETAKQFASGDGGVLHADHSPEHDNSRLARRVLRNHDRQPD